MELENMPGTGATYAPTIETLRNASVSHVAWSDLGDLYSLVPYPKDYWTRAETRQCFTTEEPNVQVTWTDVNSGNDVTVRSLGSLAELRDWNTDSNRTGSDLRVISVSQKNSWRPLNVTRQIFQEIIDITGASSEVLEYPLAFCRKRVGVEEAFSSAPMFKSNDHSIEIAYLMKYAFCKSLEDNLDPWVIRQTAVYQKYDTETNQSTWIFLNPTPDCVFQKRLATLLQIPRQVLAFKRQPLLIHNVLSGTFFPLWRDYLAYYERKVLTIANTNMAQRIEEELRVNHETLGTVRHAEARCLSLQPIFRSLRKTFQALHDVNEALAERNITQQSDAHAMKQLLNNYVNLVDAYTQQAWFLKSRTACLAVSITDTLSFKDSNTAKRQTQYMLDLTLSTVDDSTTVRVITIVTLIYLPSTFIATLLGMSSFFEMDPNDHNLVVSPKFWVYVVLSVPLTAATLLYWWVLKNTKQRMKSKSKEDTMERGSMYD
ncbi:uncharacterized protein N7482_007881 [Penicillium canariense]|uniref:CorA-like transporter domain-containing protein n=1 Tax=Penicillium canariense TaxID=189055 RepID=A0A9W9LJL1_9EURO|nr:uncharacterized protein N7482_007881 [Penicillium canariense]KAJ5160877.1 hypothetical protein N7482_007881 [Penicillium canariense]